MRLVLALLAGALFGIGLIAAGMTDPHKVRAFLDVAGAWDPSLALVMAGAIAVGALGVRLGVHYVLAQVVATLTSLVLTFAINRRWTFAA